MTLLGILSLAQIVVLPGYLALRVLRVGTGGVCTCILSFALSLVINYYLVAGLVLLGAYRPNVIYAIFAAELAWLATLDGWRLRTGLADAAAAWRQRARVFLAELEYPEREAVANQLSGPALALRRSMLAAAVLVIGGFALSGLAQVGQIFQQWDAVVSWNRWAVDWAAGRLPSATSFYPQLLPTNLSLSYVFVQSSQVWIFAKSFQFLFCLLLLLAILDMARLQGKFGYVPGVVITYGLLVALLRFRMLSSGYADVPLAFFALATVYAIMLAQDAKPASQRAKYLMLGVALAAGAAATKQMGLYVAALYPLLAWRFVLRGEGAGRWWKHVPSTTRQDARTDVGQAFQPDSSGQSQAGKPDLLCVLAGRCLPLLVGMWTIIGILVSPWYLYKFFDFRAGGDANNTLALLTDFHEGRNLWQRMAHGGAAIAESLTPTGAALLAIAVAASLGDRFQRWLVALVVVPLGLLWAIAFSYDLRNLALILPLAGSAAGIGLVRIGSWAAALYRRRLRETESGMVQTAKGVGEAAILVANPALRWGKPSGGGTKSTDRLRRAWLDSLRLGHLAGAVAALLAVACLCVSDAALLDCQRRQQQAVGVPELNRCLYAYAADHPDCAAIATDYQAMEWLPDLGGRSVVCTCQELAAFRRAFDRPEVGYVLVRTQGAAAEVRGFLEDPTAAHLVFENHGFAFYEKRFPRIRHGAPACGSCAFASGTRSVPDTLSPR